MDEVGEVGVAADQVGRVVSTESEERSIIVHTCSQSNLLFILWEIKEKSRSFRRKKLGPFGVSASLSRSIKTYLKNILIVSSLECYFCGGE